MFLSIICVIKALAIFCNLESIQDPGNHKDIVVGCKVAWRHVMATTSPHGDDLTYYFSPSPLPNQHNHQVS